MESIPQKLWMQWNFFGKVQDSGDRNAPPITSPFAALKTVGQ
jgi:hypothetical protein